MSKLQLENVSYVYSPDTPFEKEALTDTELAQVEDIVKRKTDISIENITITAVKPDAK